MKVLSALSGMPPPGELLATSRQVKSGKERENSAYGIGEEWKYTVSLLETSLKLPFRWYD